MVSAFRVGTGFPLLELAQRLGTSCRAIGIDPWRAATERAGAKLRIWKIPNAALITGRAEQMPFADNSFDLIVSNNGLNNVSDQRRVLLECFRISRPGAQMVLTLNLPDTMKEFYQPFEQVLRELGKTAEIQKVRDHLLSKRQPLQSTTALISRSGFRIDRILEDSFYLRFLNGQALLNHSFIKLAFTDGWKSIVEPEHREYFFSLLEEKLNLLAKEIGEISLTIPFACIDCRREP